MSVCSALLILFSLSIRIFIASSKQANDCEAFVGYNLTTLQSQSPGTCSTGYEPIYANGTVVFVQDNGATNRGYYHINSSNSVNHECYMTIEWPDLGMHECLTWSPTEDLQSFIACWSLSPQTEPITCITQCTPSTDFKNGWVAAILTNKLED